MNNPIQSYLDTLSDGSQAVVRSRVKLIAAALDLESPDEIDWREMNYQRAMTIVAALRRREGLSLSTVNATVIALRRIADEAKKFGLIASEENQAIQDIRGLRSSREMSGRALDAEEIGRLFKFKVEDLRGYRDKAILAALIGCGLRRAEIVALDLSSLEVKDEMLALAVIGKGDKERAVYVPDGAADHLNAWLDRRGEHPGAMFQRINKAGVLVRDSRLSAQAVYLICQQRGLIGHVERFTPHDLRRTFITEMLDVTDAVTVADTVGHADVNTTRRYDRRADRAKRAAAKRFPIRLNS